MDKNEKYIKTVIKRFGGVINLKETPYVLIEILNDYKRVFADDPYPPDNPCGGVGPPPKSSIRQSDIASQIAELTATVRRLDRKLNKLVKSRQISKFLKK
jgi:hypothetical protein